MPAADIVETDESALNVLQQTVGNQATRRVLAPAVQRVLTPETLLAGTSTRLRGGTATAVNTGWSPLLPQVEGGATVSVDWSQMDSTGEWVWAERADGRSGWLRASKIRRAGTITARQQKTNAVMTVFNSVGFLRNRLTTEQLVSRVRVLTNEEFDEVFIANKRSLNARNNTPQTDDELRQSAFDCEAFQVDVAGAPARIIARASAGAAVVLHEALHFVSSPALQQDAGDLANEGATEFFRMQAVADQRHALFQPVKDNYRRGYDVFVRLSQMMSIEDLRGVYFNGNMRPLKRAIDARIDPVLLNTRLTYAERVADEITAEVNARGRTGYVLWCALMKMERTDEALGVLRGDISPDTMAGVLGGHVDADDANPLYPAAPPM